MSRTKGLHSKEWKTGRWVKEKWKCDLMSYLNGIGHYLLGNYKLQLACIITIFVIEFWGAVLQRMAYIIPME